jgi:hypothetical protein
VGRENLDEAIKRCGVKNPTAAFAVLESVGFNLIYHGANGLTCPGGYKKCVVVAVRTPANPHSSLYNTDGQIFSDIGAPVVLFMENYDINRTGYHDTHDTLDNIDLDYGAALAAIAIETVARVATQADS